MLTDYLDFDLLIERSDAGYRARVLHSPAGEATNGFTLPFSDLQLENFLLRVGQPRRSVRRLETAELALAKEFGQRLFTALFQAEVLSCLSSSLHEASRSGKGLRLRFRLSDVPELADVPWEFIYSRATNLFFCLSTATPIVRFLELPEPIEPLEVQPPLKILAMISAPADYPALETEQEWAKLEAAVADLKDRGQVELVRLERATLAELRRVLRRGTFHVFHFIGHGGFNEQAQDGVLLLETELGGARPVSGQEIGVLLRNHRSLRLAVLNACEGARSSRTDPFAGTAQSLLQQGIPAVIAMQFEITDQAAITLAHEFYAAVADGYAADAALAEARTAVYAEGHGVEWGTPVLYMRSPDGRLFDIAPSTGTEPGSAVPAAPIPPRDLPRPVVAPPAPPPAELPKFQPAPMKTRAVAGLIDASVLGSLFYVLGKLTGVSLCLECPFQGYGGFLYDSGRFGGPYFTPLAVLLAATYTTYWNGRRGQTPGKVAVSLRMTEQFTRESIGVGRALVRALPFLLGLWVALSVLRDYHAAPLLVLLVPPVLNMMWPLWDANRQTWFDKLVGSVIVSDS